MKESLDQANDQDMTKKKRKDGKGKENISCDQADSTAQEDKKAREKRQAMAEKTTANNMGQLMFASRYGNKFLSTEISTETPATNPTVVTQSQLLSSSHIDDLPLTPSPYEAIPQATTNSATSPGYQAARQQVLNPAITPAFPLVHSPNQVLPSVQLSYQTLHQSITPVPTPQQAKPPGSALQVNYPAVASLTVPGPSAKPGNPLAPQSMLLNVTSTNPPVPTTKQMAPQALADDPQAMPPTAVSNSLFSQLDH